MSHYPTGIAQQHVASSLAWVGAGSAPATAAPQPPNGLMLDAGAIMARLSSIYDRVCRLNDRLNGYRPSPCETEATKPAEADTMRRLTDRSIDLINVIELELNFIEAKL